MTILLSLVLRVSLTSRKQGPDRRCALRVVGTSFAPCVHMANVTPRFVRDLMTRRVAILFEEQNLELAEHGMKEFRFRHLPVVDGGKIVGLVSESDLLRASVSTLNADFALLDDNLKRNFFVREVMTSDVVTVRPDTLLSEAASLMQERKIGCLPVTESDGKLVGILTQSDFVGLAKRFLDQRELEARSSRHLPPPPPARGMKSARR
ncbi:MAG TPA: CBS domain-containing protein [Polyangiaceae bacterium]|nr:CBS domain-containing protein [Polyangiaceae bacterium]